MSALEVAQAQYVAQQQLVNATAAAGAQMWSLVDPARLSESWAQFLPRLLTILRGAQLAAARPADIYTDRALYEQGFSVHAAGRVSADAFTGVASDGRPLESLLLNPVIAAKAAILQGADGTQAMATGQASLEMMLRTQVADSGRVATGVAVVARASVSYVRMLNPPACSRCVVLAGRVYRFNDGFQRHPQCDCLHIPTHGEEAAKSEGLISDPKAYFESLTSAEQDRTFTHDGAQAIRDGADMNQVVNARRGAAGLAPAGARITNEEKAAIGSGRLATTNVFGRELFLTSEGTTRRGIAGKRLIERSGARKENAETVTRISRTGEVQRTVKRQRAQIPRLMPESIYQLATDRDDAIRLLRLYGYIV